MAENKTGKSMPKGGRKGGSVFPRVTLRQAHEYAKKLVSKTHTGAQPAEVICPGVFDVQPKGKGNVRTSALRQYGWLEGNNEGMQATGAARSLCAAPAEQAVGLMQTACLLPRVFRKLYDTFQGDTVSPAKLRQQALAQNVHPESADECVSIFIDSLEYAQLGKRAEDDVEIVPAGTAVEPPGESADGKPECSDENEGETDQEKPVGDRVSGTGAGKDGSRRSVVHVNVNLDSSLDTEKLEKQLELLRRYGAL